MVLVCLIVIAALAACVLSAWQRNRAEDAPQSAAKSTETDFDRESVAYGESVLDHPMMEQEAANFCERIKADIQRSRRPSGEL